MHWKTYNMAYIQFKIKYIYSWFLLPIKPLIPWWATSDPAPKAIPVMNIPDIPDKKPPLCCGWATGWVSAGLGAGLGGDWLVDLDLDDPLPPKPPPMYY